MASIQTRVQYPYEPPKYLSNDARDSCALVYMDANRNLEYHLGYSRWTLFGRIIRQLDEYFRENAPEQQQQSLEEHFDQIQKLLRTRLYSEFEQTFTSSFAEQLKRTTHQVTMEFRAFDPLNYYRSLQTLLIEAGNARNSAHAGQGMRNLILLALFRTYAKVFKGDAFIAIEEPEIYLHPHAQRSLARLFDELSAQGNQIFYSTHSGNFIDIEHFDRVCLVEKCRDDEDDICTQVRQVPLEYLLRKRQQLHPGVSMNVSGPRRRYHNICGLEHNEALFARKIVLVEGETEEYALPIFGRALDFDFDTYGVSVVNAHGKNNLDQLFQLYNSFGFPIYLIFDNDRGGNQSDLAANKVLLRMLNKPETLKPDGTIEDTYAIFEGNFEREMMLALERVAQGKYQQLKQEARQELGGGGKGLVARYMAQQLVHADIIPDFIETIIRKIQVLGEPTSKADSPTTSSDLEVFDEDIPF